MPIIADLFASYRSQVLNDAPAVQVQECEKAFYAGAYGLFCTLIGLMSEGDDVTEADILVMDTITSELESFIVANAASEN